jgi:hypothetical protein
MDVLDNGKGIKNLDFALLTLGTKSRKDFSTKNFMPSNLA